MAKFDKKVIEGALNIGKMALRDHLCRCVYIHIPCVSSVLKSDEVISDLLMVQK